MGGRAFVILDLASFRHEIADVNGRPGRQEDLHLKNLSALLKTRGYEITGLAVALPILAVNKAPNTHSETALELTARSRAWVQREANGRRFEVLPGGIDGSHEVGVDDIIVVRALVEADAIRTNDARSGEKLLILSHDSDLQHLSQFADGVDVRIVGRGAKFNARYMRARQVEYEGFADEEMRFLCTKDAIVPEISEALVTERVPVVPVRPPPVVNSPTVAVVDGYGIACSAANALGISELPSAESVRAVLCELGFGGVNSVQFVLPDVNLNARPREGQPELSQFEKSAWAARDSQLDGLERDLLTDDDAGTEVVRGILTPVHMPEAARTDPARMESVRHTKQHSTLITASVVRQWLLADSSDVVVVTDVPDVVVALEYLISRHAHLRPARITRIGALARPIHPVRGGRHLQLPFVLMTERRLAQMTRIRSRRGRDLRTDIGMSPSTNGLLHEQWQIVGFEPEVRGLRARSIEKPDVEVVIMDSLVLGLSVEEVVDGKQLDLAIYGDPNKPCDPLMLVTGGSQAENATHPLVAEVVRRDSDAIHFDIDGDGSPDVALSAGHDFRPVRAGAPAVLGYLHGDAKTLRYVAVSDEDGDQSSRCEKLAKISDVQTNAVSATIDDRQVNLHSAQQSTLIGLREGDSVLVIDVGSENSPHYVVLSSALGDRARSALSTSEVSDSVT